MAEQIVLACEIYRHLEEASRLVVHRGIPRTRSYLTAL